MLLHCQVYSVKANQSSIEWDSVTVLKKDRIMEITATRPQLSLSTVVQAGLNSMRRMAAWMKAFDGNQSTKTTTHLSSYLLRDIGLSPNFAIQDTSNPYLWRI